jgi:hypothetical protein
VCVGLGQARARPAGDETIAAIPGAWQGAWPGAWLGAWPIAGALGALSPLGSKRRSRAAIATRS